MTRLSQNLRDIGDVALQLPITTDTLAHRIRHYAIREARTGAGLGWGTGFEVGGHLATRPGCMSAADAAEAGRFAELSAYRADELGAQACPECWPDADDW